MAAQRRYPDELRERAVKMVLDIRERDGKGHGEIARGGPVDPPQNPYGTRKRSSSSRLTNVGASHRHGELQPSLLCTLSAAGMSSGSGTRSSRTAAEPPSSG
jgi:hypothetical protein